jgi:ribonuclease HII
LCYQGISQKRSPSYPTCGILLEHEARQQGIRCIAGVDEAGRGPLAGPVVAAACILPAYFPYMSEMKDSKQISPKERERLYALLISHPEVIYSIQVVSEKIIDKKNILQATLLAMKRAVESLKVSPTLVLVDGNVLPSIKFPAYAIVKGDILCPSISAASILAKVTRDAIVCQYDKKWPEWRFSTHKGYGTPHHLCMIKQHGILPVHRKSFDPIKSMINPSSNEIVF